MSGYIHYNQISPYIRYVNDFKKRGYSDLGERVIYDHEFFFCVDGKAKMYMDGEVYDITRGDIFYLRPNLKNRMIIENGQFFHAHCVHFDWHFIDESFNFTAEDIYISPSQTAEARAFKSRLSTRPTAEVEELPFPALIRGTDYERLLPMFRGMYNAYRDNTTASHLKLRGLFLQAVSEMMFCKEIDFSTTVLSHRSIVEKTLEHIHANYRGRISVPALAKSVGMSSKYFGVIFKKITGNTVNEYVTLLRMQRAEELLLKTSMSLSEIANEIGVADEYYIVKLFKKYKGITPGRFRKMMLSNNDM